MMCSSSRCSGLGEWGGELKRKAIFTFLWADRDSAFLKLGPVELGGSDSLKLIWLNNILCKLLLI